MRCPICRKSFKDGHGSNVYENVSRDQIGQETCSDEACIEEVKRRNLANHKKWFPDEYMIMGPTGTLIGVENLPQMDIVRLQDGMNRANHQLHVLGQKIEQINKTLADRIEQVEKIKFAEFKNNDVYEVNKRIERLQGKIALLESNSNPSAVSANLILALIAINNLFLGLVWWIYG